MGNWTMEYHYLQLANELEQKIRAGNYRAGDRLPSLRTLRSRTGRSISTVYQAYNELEDRGVVEVREKSGFYVKPLLENVLPRPVKEKGAIKPLKVTINSHSTMLQQYTSNPDMLPLGTAIPSPELLPLKHLARELRSAASGYMDGSAIGYGHPSGVPQLRSELAKLADGYFSTGKGEEIIVTNGCLSAIDLCLRAVARQGDVILIESPTFLCYLQLIEDLKMQALEIPVDAETGFDLDMVEKALAEHDVKAALINANFHNPLGYVLEVEMKKSLVRMFAEREIPIIEDDVYGDLYFTETRPVPLKSFDRDGLVLYCSSFTKSLAPDLRVGWTMPGRFKELVKRIKFNAGVTSSQLTQLVAARFLASGAYDRHLRRMRNALKKQAANMMMGVARHFPEGTRMSAPKGGLSLWVELDRRIDGQELFARASRENIAVVPGYLCTVTNRFNHCIRLNCGYPWSDRLDNGLRVLGRLIEEMMREESG